jgi:hypothetical protein
LFYKDELIAVAGLWISRKFAAKGNEEGWVVEIESMESRED